MTKAKVGIDIGGTQSRVGLVVEGKIIETTKHSTNHLDPIPTMAWIAEEINKWKKSYDIEIVGISCPGPLDIPKGVILDPANLREKWHNFAIRDHMHKATGIKTDMNNDANLQGLAHAVYGEGQKYKVVQFFTFSTGLGAGLVINKQIFVGEKGYAQEIANIPMGIDGWTYGSSLHPGSIESIASGTGIRETAKNRGLQIQSAAEVFALAKQGNEIAKKILAEVKVALVKLLCTTIAFINPGIIIFDGSVATSNKEFMEEIFKETETKIFDSLKGMTKYAVSDFGGTAGILGAAALKGE